MLRYVVPNYAPTHIHDCNDCTFHGTQTIQGRAVDFYTCDDTVIGRYGSDGPEYWSTLASICVRDAEFFEREVPYGPRFVELARSLTS